MPNYISIILDNFYKVVKTYPILWNHGIELAISE